jgi:hypothetical protein
MDPNAALLAIREACNSNDFRTAAEVFEGLDMWLTRGGFLPSSWESNVGQRLTD